MATPMAIPMESQRTTCPARTPATVPNPAPNAIPNPVYFGLFISLLQFLYRCALVGTAAPSTSLRASSRLSGRVEDPAVLIHEAKVQSKSSCALRTAEGGCPHMLSYDFAPAAGG